MSQSGVALDRHVLAGKGYNSYLLILVLSAFNSRICRGKNKCQYPCKHQREHSYEDMEVCNERFFALPVQMLVCVSQVNNTASPLIVCLPL